MAAAGNHPMLDAMFRDALGSPARQPPAADQSSSSASAAAAARRVAAGTTCEELEKQLPAVASAEEAMETARGGTAARPLPLRPAPSRPPAPLAAADDTSPLVFVGGVPCDLEEGDLAAVFGQWGAVDSVRLIRDRSHGGAVQVDPLKPTLKAPETKRLKLQCDELLSNFGFKFNLRR